MSIGSMALFSSGNSSPLVCLAVVAELGFVLVPLVLAGIGYGGWQVWRAFNKLTDRIHKLEAAEKARPLAERVLLSEVMKGGPSKGVAAHLAEEIAELVQRRMEQVRFSHPDTDVWKQWVATADQVIVQLTRDLPHVGTAQVRDTLYQPIAQEVASRYRTLCAQRFHPTWDTLDAVNDAAIVQSTKELMEQHRSSVERLLLPQLIDELLMRLQVARDNRDIDTLWHDLDPVLDQILVLSASRLDPENVKHLVNPELIESIRKAVEERRNSVREDLEAALDPIVRSPVPVEALIPTSVEVAEIGGPLTVVPVLAATEVIEVETPVLRPTLEELVRSAQQAEESLIIGHNKEASSEALLEAHH